MGLMINPDKAETFMNTKHFALLGCINTEWHCFSFLFAAQQNTTL
jgi:hypothetical protein